MAKFGSCAIISSQAFSLFNFRGPLISDLVAVGITVYALAPDYDDDIRQKIAALGAQPIDFQLVRTGMNPLSDVVDMFKLVALLRHLRPDVTLCYFIKPVIFGTLAAWMAGVPKRVAMIEGLGYVFTASDDSHLLRRKLLRSVVGRLYRLALGRAHKVIFLNDDDLKEFVGARIVAPSKVVKLGGIGVALDDWPDSLPVVVPVTFLLAARLLREKGIVEYAEAARLVKKLHPEVRFVLLGGLDPNPHCLKQWEVEEWVSQGLLEWPGHVDVKPWLARASVFVLPSFYREGVPRSTQEAMSMGRAVITTDAPGCRETVDEGVNGFLVPVRDVAALARTMLRFVDDPSLIGRMGQESRRLAQERFDVRKINARLLQILDATGNRHVKHLHRRFDRTNRAHQELFNRPEISHFLSISVVSHGQIEMVEKLLRDIEKYCGYSSFELILTLNLHEQLPFALDSFSYPIKLIRNKTPKGFSANQNQAFTHAVGHYFCVMNPDIKLNSNPFGPLLECFEDSSVGVVAPLVLGEDGVLEDSARRFPSPLKILCKSVGGCTGADYEIKDTLIYPDWVGGMFMLFPCGVWEQLGGFDERYFLYYEDVNICARLRLLGHQVVMCPHANVIHYAQRRSHRSFKYLSWHFRSMARFFFSTVYWRLHFAPYR